MALAVILIVFGLFLGAIFTAGYTEDRTFHF